MDQLHALGVRIAIDDFGTGYSSLTYLSRLPVDQLKVDRYFVSGLGIVESRTAIVQTIVRLCRDLDLLVTAEGVEEPHQLELLREMGVNHLQGFLISKPLSAADIAAFLDSAVPLLLSPGTASTQEDSARVDLADWSDRRTIPAVSIPEFGLPGASHGTEVADLMPD
jgi:predicted signal transduction protein with EAL and GGDEF domain